MFAVTPLISSAPILSLPSVPATITPDAVSTRVTLAAATAPSQNLQVNDNAHNSSIIPPIKEITNSSSQIETLNTDPHLNTAPSSPYLTQAIAQENEQQSSITLAQSFTHIAPAPEYNTLVAYSLVKYKPSNAGAPQDFSSTPSNLDSKTNTTINAYSNTQSRNLAEFSSHESHIAITS
jgi:hypothetical protein